MMRCRAFCPNSCWKSPTLTTVIRFSTKTLTPFDAATDSGRNPLSPTSFEMVLKPSRALLEISVLAQFRGDLSDVQVGHHCRVELHAKCGAQKDLSVLFSAFFDDESAGVF